MFLGWAPRRQKYEDFPVYRCLGLRGLRVPVADHLCTHHVTVWPQAAPKTNR